MLTKEENEFLTRVGPGTPGGNLLRKYWHPVFPSAELSEGRTKRIRVLGEDLVVFKLKNGTIGLLDDRCSHRLASLSYGFVEEDGLRCAYHGWKYSKDGACIEQPFEPDSSDYKSRIKQKSYKAEELCGLVWVYMGDDPVPELPKLKLFTIKNGLRWVMYTDLNANWVQLAENMHDGQHVFYLHGEMMYRRAGLETLFHKKIDSIEFTPYDWGIIPKRTYVFEDGSKYKELGHPIIFPNINYALPSPVGITCNVFVPIDDAHSRFIALVFIPSASGEEMDQDYIPSMDITSIGKPSNAYNMDNINGTDMMAWETQGAILDRTKEHLGASDRGAIMFRQLLKKEILKVQDKKDPIALSRNGIVEPEELNLQIAYEDFGQHQKINGALQQKVYNSILRGKIPEEAIGFGGKVKGSPSTA